MAGLSAMYFFDGTNFLNELKRHLNVKLDPHRPPAAAFELANAVTGALQRRIPGSHTVRRTWCGSYYGAEDVERLLVDALHAQRFQARLLRKRKDKPEKGVDMAVAVQMLTEAFNRNFGIGWLIAGDADYCDLVKEARRYGTVIHGAFFPDRTSDPLRRSFDEFHSLADLLQEDDVKDKVERLLEHLRSNKKTIPACPCCLPEPPPCPACSGSGRSPTQD